MATNRETPGMPDEDVVDKLTRLAELEAATPSLRHDLRGMLAPALFVAKRLLAHTDPEMVRAGETLLQVIERAEGRLLATRLPVQL